ncbi:MAG: RNA polymerase Rpb4 family protein [Candidatus Micrarchaeia archaeon]
MIGKKILNSKPVPLCDVLEMLVERENEGEIGFEQKNALEYARKHSHLSSSKAHEVIEKLLEKPYISRAMAVKIVDLLPRKESEIMLILQQERKDITPAQAKEVLGIISEAFS